ncbi:MAG: tRNA threonylcarbamoyladenosine dehydratase [Deltaproteobacteria bacterium]|nr:tRNA threonylcarbamoyladenosine dehydratase [Deltaproteobacteria bacterium]
MDRSDDSRELDQDAAHSFVLDESAEAQQYRLHRRFDRIGRLVGDQGMAKLFASHVVVVGLGGVGSFAAESLARSGVGRLTLVDFDKVCVTNANRQVQATQRAVGKAKAVVLAERVQDINPQVRVEGKVAFFSAATAEAILGGPPPDFVVDAIDNISAKCQLLAICHQRAIPVVCSTGASARYDPTAIRVVDLAETKLDPLAGAVRRILRTKYDFPEKGPFGIPAVYSLETVQPPRELTYDKGRGFRCVCPGEKSDQHSCEERAVIYGNASFVTGAFGLACASVVVRGLCQTLSDS